MKRTSTLIILGTLIAVLLNAGCAHRTFSWHQKQKHPNIKKTNSPVYHQKIIPNPARLPASEPTSVMAVPAPARRPLPEEVRF